MAPATSPHPKEPENLGKWRPRVRVMCLAGARPRRESDSGRVDQAAEDGHIRFVVGDACVISTGKFLHHFRATDNFKSFNLAVHFSGTS